MRIMPSQCILNGGDPHLRLMQHIAAILPWWSVL